MRVSLCVFFSLCCCTSVAFCSNDLNPVEIENPNQVVESGCSFSCEDFRALEMRNQEQGKDIEELIAKVNSLSGKFEEFKSQISSDHGVWLLTPPLRGPPGKQGLIGENGEKGGRGEKGAQSSLASEPITSCSVAMEILPSPRSAKQLIYPHGNSTKVQVLCDFQVDDGGWTVIQKRSSGSREEFNLNWTEYSNGFGSLDRNFWLGLENIRALTKNGDQELRIELEDFEGEKKYAKYSNFSILDASDFYRLSVGGFDGNSTAGDSMTSHNGMRFHTKDKNDSGGCAKHYSSGWWFTSCFAGILNGLYREKGETGGWKGIIWNSWKRGVFLAKTEMKIRNRKLL